MHEKLLDIIKQQVTITDNDINLCIDYFEPVLFPKNKIIEEEPIKPGLLQRKMTYVFQFVLPSTNGIINTWITIQFLLFLMMKIN